MSIARERVAPPTSQRSTSENRMLNAQKVTSIALSFLKSLGHKRGVKPKCVFIENQRYVVEAEIGKRTIARVQMNMETSDITEYRIEKKAEESEMSFPVEPKAVLLILGISSIVSLIFAMLDLGALLGGLL